MIIEIALGIVLGVLILRFLPEIFALGYFAILLGFALLVFVGIGFAIYLLATNEQVSRSLHSGDASLGIFVGFAFQLLIAFCVGNSLEARTPIRGWEAYLFGTILYVMFLATVVSVPVILMRYGNTDEGKDLLLLFPVVGAWVFVCTLISVRIKKLKHRMAPECLTGRSTGLPPAAR